MQLYLGKETANSEIHDFMVDTYVEIFDISLMFVYT